MTFDPSPGQPFWLLFTRLGEIQILLPAVLLASLVLLRQPRSKPLAFYWLAWLLVATLITTATKLAFLGWGMGIRHLDFTGISGHAMFAAAIYPVLLAVLASRLPRGGQRFAIVMGALLALGIGLSRIEVGAHSVSEVVAGLLLGGAVSVMALVARGLPRDGVGPLVPLVIALWLLLTPVHTPQSPAHSWVIRLSLMLAGTATPHTRADLLNGSRGLESDGFAK